MFTISDFMQIAVNLLLASQIVGTRLTRVLTAKWVTTFLAAQSSDAAACQLGSQLITVCVVVEIVTEIAGL